MRLCPKDLRTNLKRLTKAKFGVILALKKKKAVNDNNTQLDLLIERKKNQ